MSSSEPDGSVSPLASSSSESSESESAATAAVSEPDGSVSASASSSSESSESESVAIAATPSPSAASAPPSSEDGSDSSSSSTQQSFEDIAADPSPCVKSSPDEESELAPELSDSDTATRGATGAVAADPGLLPQFIETVAVGDSSTSLEKHATSHNFPIHVKTCGLCRFWKHRVRWSAICSATNPVTLKNETWLGHAAGGWGVCIFCAAYKGSRCRSELGRGKGCFSRLQHMTRHAIGKEHEEAEVAWKERVQGEGVDKLSEAAATAVPIAPIFVRKAAPKSGGRAVVATRALLETCSSFESFDLWRNAFLGDEREAVGSSAQCREMVSTLALHETLVTQKILKAGVVFRLSADGLDRTYQVEIGTVLWSLPKPLEFLLSYGKNASWLDQLGPNGPWVVERLIGMREFPQALDCDGRATMLEACARRACQTEDGEVDLGLHKHVREETRAWCSDGADLNVP